MARTSVHMTFVGDKELMRKLGALGDRVYRKVVAKASRKAFAPVVDAAKNLAPSESGLLKSSIGVKQKKYPSAGRIVTIVGPRTGFGARVVVNLGGERINQYRDPVRYGHLVEFGAAPHTIKTENGEFEHPGAPAQPFLRPAFDANERKTVSRMKAYLSIGVAREAKKQGKKK